MRAALIVNKITGKLETDLAFMEQLGREASASEAELILFPEAAATGLLNNG